jgi:hypothetical protein
VEEQDRSLLRRQVLKGGNHGEPDVVVQERARFRI